MKRNFLFMLLLTLLPLVGWAQVGPDGPSVPVPQEPTDLRPVTLSLSSTEATISNVTAFPTVTVTPEFGDALIQGTDYTITWYKGDEPINDYATYSAADFDAVTYTVVATLIDPETYVWDDSGNEATFTVTAGTPEPSGEATTTELEVKPKTSCVMYYGLALELGVNDILVTPSVSNEVKLAMLEKLKINQDLTAIKKLGFQEFDLGLVDVTDDKVTVGGVTYTISPTGKGVVDIRKGTNELVYDEETEEYVFANATGLVFNGYDQNLIVGPNYSFTSYDAEVEGNVWGTGTVKYVRPDNSAENPVSEIVVLENSYDDSFVGRTFYVYAQPEDIPEGRLQLYTKDAETGDFEETGVWVETKLIPWSTYNKVDFLKMTKEEFQGLFNNGNNLGLADAQTFDPDAYAAEHETFTANWTNNALPQGRDAGEYYVWAKASNGGELYSGGAAVFVGVTTIAKADPVLAGTVEVDATYYYKEGNSQNLSTEIVPSVDKLTVGVGEYSEPVIADNIQYYIKVGTKSGEEITYAWPNGTKPTLASYEFEPGYYQIIATFKANKNFNTLLVNAAAAAGITDEFEVKRPTVTIQTLVKEGVSAIYAYGAEIPEKDLDWEVQKDKDGNIIGWHGYEGTLDPEEIGVTYVWKNSRNHTVNPENGLAVGTYTVTASGNFNAGDDFGTPEILPATVIITASNILAAIEDQTLVFGQELPLKLKYSQGGYAPESEEIEDFEDIMWTEGFKAKMIRDANGDEVKDAEPIDLYAKEDHHTGNGNNRVNYYLTTILPVGTYEVTAPELVKNDKGWGQDNKPEFTLLVAKGTWTVTPKDINNEDFGNRNYDTPDPRVKGMGRRSFNKHETYTSKEITFGLRDLAGDFTYRDGDFDFSDYGTMPLDGDNADEGQTSILPEDLVIPEDIQAIIAEIKETGKATDAQILEVLDFFMPILKKGLDPKGYYYGSLLLGKDFEITSYTNNINAGTATFHVKGIGNFKGERDLTFTIDKAKIYVFPETKEDGNVWAVGSNQKDAFQVDWNSKAEVEVEDGVKVPVGIKYQLHAFENDRQKDMTGENGFKALKVKFTVGANVGEYEAGLKAYAENDEKADNYEFVFETAPLTIVQGTILLAVDDVEVTYSGKNKPQYTPGFKLAEGQKLDPALEQNWRTVVNDSKTAGLTFEDDLEADENGRYNAGEYTITCTAFPAGTYESINYRFELAEGAEEGTLTVNPAEATIAVKAWPLDAPENTVVKNYKDFIDAATDWNNEHADEPRSAEYYKQEFIDQIGDVLNDKNGMPSEFRNPDYFSVTGMQAGDTKFDLFGGAEVDDENNIIVSDNGNTNYDFTLTNGFLVIAPVNETLELTSEPVVYWTDKWGDYTDGEWSAEFPDGHDLPDGAEPVVKNGGDLAKIKTYDKVPVKAVTIKLKAATLDPENEAYSEWKAGQWHTMVLPFATTVGEIAYNFKYAIVNVVDVNATNAATKPNEVHFMLQEIMDEIPANTPFMIKSQYDFDYDNTLLYFGNVEGALAEKLGDTNPIYIEYDAKPSVEAGKTYTFEGTYDQMVIDKNTLSYKFIGPDNRWKQFSETSTSKYTLQPYAGYLNLQGLTGTREVVCFFEEEDGSTTAINAAELQNVKSAEGLYRVDGIKLQSAPTQKGVYIQNGKKFVK